MLILIASLIVIALAAVVILDKNYSAYKAAIKKAELDFTEFKINMEMKIQRMEKSELVMQGEIERLVREAREFRSAHGLDAEAGDNRGAA